MPTFFERIKQLSQNSSKAETKVALPRVKEKKKFDRRMFLKLAALFLGSLVLGGSTAPNDIKATEEKATEPPTPTSAPTAIPEKTVPPYPTNDESILKKPKSTPTTTPTAVATDIPDPTATEVETFIKEHNFYSDLYSALGNIDPQEFLNLTVTDGINERPLEENEKFVNATLSDYESMQQKRILTFKILDGKVSYANLAGLIEIPKDFEHTSNFFTTTLSYDKFPLTINGIVVKNSTDKSLTVMILGTEGKTRLLANNNLGVQSLNLNEQLDTLTKYASTAQDMISTDLVIQVAEKIYNQGVTHISVTEKDDTNLSQATKFALELRDKQLKGEDGIKSDAAFLYALADKCKSLKLPFFGEGTIDSNIPPEFIQNVVDGKTDEEKIGAGSACEWKITQNYNEFSAGDVVFVNKKAYFILDKTNQQGSGFEVNVATLNDGIVHVLKVTNKDYLKSRASYIFASNKAK